MDQSVTPGAAEIVEVDRLVGSVEATHADMDDSATESPAVVLRDRDTWIEPAEAPRRELLMAPAAFVTSHGPTLLQHKRRWKPRTKPWI